MYIYERSEPGLYTVGFYDPSGKWHSDSDHADRQDAAARVNYLNGGGNIDLISLLETVLKYLEHPDVVSIPFALSVSVISSAVKQAITNLKGQ